MERAGRGRWGTRGDESLAWCLVADWEGLQLTAVPASQERFWACITSPRKEFLLK
jgi:hypothetical protein